MGRTIKVRVVKRAVFYVAPLFLAACAGGRGWNGSVQCAPYAREHSAVNLRGAAASWWGQAGRVYGRSNTPRRGDVLVFRSTRRLPSGHVSVVQQVKSARLVLVEHANWEPGRITRSAPVEDVSAANDWTRVRVWWSPIKGMGKTIYPTYGFIEP